MPLTNNPAVKARLPSPLTPEKEGCVCQVKLQPLKQFMLTEYCEPSFSLPSISSLITGEPHFGQNFNSSLRLSSFTSKNLLLPEVLKHSSYSFKHGAVLV